MVLAIERCLAYDFVIPAFCLCCCCWCCWWTLPTSYDLYSLCRHLSDSLARVIWRVFHSKLRRDFMRVSLLIHAASSLMGTRDSNDGHAPSRQLRYTSSLPMPFGKKNKKHFLNENTNFLFVIANRPSRFHTFVTKPIELTKNVNLFFIRKPLYGRHIIRIWCYFKSYLKYTSLYSENFDLNEPFANTILIALLALHK
jgi:hypothetical protein